ncbi:hypothetical protein [Nesterenkonia lutea]|uniref:Uncharacterized protein n=1 Tax=Nesterenkonia lutea TaxID=272919 RepID=A0ABR9JC36_9MICC|nr:hypothetical protein [Nesterenkonia lutea]MBE1523504.1 hypothetical protein [Nesterenkonia lutea]
MEHTESAFLSAVEGLPIPSSALIALIAALFLGTLILRGQRQASSYAAPAPVSAETATSTAAGSHTHQGAFMSANTESSRSPESSGRAESSGSPESSGPAAVPAPQSGVEPISAPAPVSGTESTTGAEPTADAGPAVRPTQGFHMHWGRTAVALLGVLALLAAVATGVLAPLTALPVAIPLAAGGVFLLCLLTLRGMAVVRRRSARRQRVQSAIEEAMNPPQAQAWEVQANRGLFDALSSDARGAGGPDSLQQIDEDGLPVSLERTFSGEHAESEPVLGAAAEPVGPWQPRAVPRPKYLDLDKAQRLEPAPLEVQIPTPKSEVKLTQQRFVEAPAPVEETTVREDSLNLDEVLKRRRA